MAHPNGHAGDAASRGASASPLLRNNAAENDGNGAQIEKSSAGQGPRPQDNSLPEEWARVSALAVKHLDRCVSLEPKVLQGDDPDAIHDLRVATRRVQQMFQLLYPSPHAGEIRKLLRGLKRCRRALSEIRNYDVLLGRVEASLARKRTARREAWEAIRDHLKQTRSVRLEKALRKLAKANLSAIYVRLKECLPSNGSLSFASETSNHSGREQAFTVEQFYKRIGESLNQVWTALEQEIARSRHEHSPAVLHRTRIAAKRARYLIEVIYAFDVPGSKEALIWLRSLQTQLGNWHDLVVFEEAVIAMIADPVFLGDHLELAIQLERLVLKNLALKSRLETKYFEMIRDKTGILKTREWVHRTADSPAALFVKP